MRPSFIHIVCGWKGAFLWLIYGVVRWVLIGLANAGEKIYVYWEVACFNCRAKKDIKQYSGGEHTILIQAKHNQCGGSSFPD